jgi:hypothetical protein
MKMLQTYVEIVGLPGSGKSTVIAHIEKHQMIETSSQWLSKVAKEELASNLFGIRHMAGFLPNHLGKIYLNVKKLNYFRIYCSHSGGIVDGIAKTISAQVQSGRMLVERANRLLELAAEQYLIEKYVANFVISDERWVQFIGFYLQALTGDWIAEVERHLPLLPLPARVVWFDHGAEVCASRQRQRGKRAGLFEGSRDDGELAAMYERQFSRLVPFLTERGVEVFKIDSRLSVEKKVSLLEPLWKKPLNGK